MQKHRHQRPALSRGPIHGLTLIELMITIVIAGILLAVGVPSFQDLIRDNRLKAHANAFISSLSLARSEAIARNARITVCSSANGAACGGTWSNGWIVFLDPNGNGVVDAGEAVIQVANTPPAGVQVQNLPAATSVRFNSRGYREGAGVLAARFDDGRAGRCRVVDVNLIGRAATRTDAAGRPVCPA